VFLREAVRRRVEKIEQILVDPGDDTFAALPSSIHRAASTGNKTMQLFYNLLNIVM
jgi:hypothetical protein